MGTRLTERRAATLGLLICLALAMSLPWPTDAGAEEPDPAPVQVLIVDRAVAHDTDPAPLLRVAACESRFSPSARGDAGRSHGLYQLNDLRTGLLWHFYAQGYDDPYEAGQAADYTARVFAGEFAREGVTRWRWTCR